MGRPPEGGEAGHAAGSVTGKAGGLTGEADSLTGKAGGPAGRAPAPVSELPAASCRSLAVVFTDIDDTLTTGGSLPPSSYQALWDLFHHDIEVVPVTGRPAGWCDHIARMWPVSAVIGENGAFCYSYDRASRKMKRRSFAGGAAAGLGPAGPGPRPLAEIAARVLREVPGTALAADQPFRVSDFAIDFCEDVAPLGQPAVDDICRILASEGVSYRVSSIHVNFWHGQYDKMTGVRTWLEDTRGGREAAATALGHSVFIGDSPNDEPLFAGFPLSIAVANLERFLPRIVSLPGYITRGESAEGFCEACREILRKREAR